MRCGVVRRGAMRCGAMRKNKNHNINAVAIKRASCVFVKAQGMQGNDGRQAGKAGRQGRVVAFM
jgi:hypothetical protein